MKTSTTDTYLLSAKVIHLDIHGIATHYTDMIWVDDDNDPEGGYYQPVRKLYATPRIKIDFLAKVDVDLEVGCVYSNGVNTFIATEKNEIRNDQIHVETFKVPTEVVCVFKPYTEIK